MKPIQYCVHKIHLTFFLIGALCVPFLSWAEQIESKSPRPIFDSHSHYSSEDRQAFSSKEIEALFKKNHIIGAAITSSPTSNTEKLVTQQQTPIAPFLGLYRTRLDKTYWMHSPSILNRLEKKLDAFPYVGIGELHIFKKDVYSTVLARVIDIAEQRHLILMIHGDAEIIDKVFQLAPNLKVIWAHLGTHPCIGLLSYMLNKYPQNLYIDTSVRDSLLLDDNQWLKPEWEAFFTQHQNRVLVAVDTYSKQRWQGLDQAVARIRLWLNQLPNDVADKLAYQNAHQLFD